MAKKKRGMGKKTYDKYKSAYNDKELKGVAMEGMLSEKNFNEAYLMYKKNLKGPERDTFIKNPVRYILQKQQITTMKQARAMWKHFKNIKETDPQILQTKDLATFANMEYKDFITEIRKRNTKTNISVRDIFVNAVEQASGMSYSSFVESP